MLSLVAAFTWDFPDGLWPTTVVALRDDPITDREIRKHFFCSVSVDGVSGRCQVMMRPNTPCVGTFAGDPRRAFWARSLPGNGPTSPPSSKEDACGSRDR